MQMQQQLVLTELSSDFQAAMRGAGSADRIAEVTSIGTPKINNGKSTIGQVQKMQSRVVRTGNIERDLYRRTSNTGAFKDLPEPMQLRHVEKIAEDAGIGLKGIK